jgi:hypothetical protein
MRALLESLAALDADHAGRIAAIRARQVPAPAG